MSRNLNMNCEIKQIRDYTDKQEARCLNLLNRVTKLQVDLLESHTDEQLNSFVNQPRKKFGLGPQRSRTTSTNSLDEHPIDSTVPNVIKHAKESSKRKRKNPIHDSQLWKMPEISDIQQTTSNIRSIISHAALSAKDLDETESSSGDSSCDETMYVNEDADGPRRLTHYLPVEDNPNYKFAADRAKIIAMWTWLQDAIGNLSYKIKQQEEFAKHLSNAKPPFQFDEQHSTTSRTSASRSPSNSALKDACIQIFTTNNNNSQVPPTSTQLFYGGERKSPFITDASGNVIQLVPPPASSPGNEPSRVLPGVQDKLSSSTPTSPQSPSTSNDRKGNNIVGGGLESLGLTIPINHDPTCVARRCLPLKPFKQRKIFQLGGIHNMSNFGCRAPTLLCSCFGRTELCAICTGRAKKTKNIEVDIMDSKEIYELLDHNYHRTLSLPDETPIPALIESGLKKEGWSVRVDKKKNKFKRIVMNWTKPRVVLGKDEQLNQDIASGIKKRPRGRPKIPKTVDQFGNVLLKPNKQLTVKTQHWRKDRRSPISRRASYGGDIAFRRSLKYPGRKKYNSVSGKKRGDRDYGSDEELFDSDYQDYDEYIDKSERRYSGGRKLNHDYDIDNIVIPYSIASSTRVEKIEYKEILTPSWRLVSPRTSEEDGEDETEDVSEDAIKIRHDRCETEEHKKFHAIPDKSNTRRSRRIDSRTESIELSSNPASPGNESVDPVSPVSIGKDDDVEWSPGSAGGRRRTISSRKDEDEDDFLEQVSGVACFEPRRFPLTDEEFEGMSIEESSEIRYESERCFSPKSHRNYSATKSYPASNIKEENNLIDLSDDDEEDNDPDWERPIW